MISILLTFDHLHLGFLGPYGNDWIETPSWNRLASDGVTFDQCLADVYPVDDRRHSFWHAQPSWLASLQAAGVRTILVTDTAAKKLPELGFDDIHAVSGTDGPDASESETAFARLMVEGDRVLQSLCKQEGNSLLWIRSRGVPRPWLPPREFMDLYFEEFGLASAETQELPDAQSEENSEAAEKDEAWEEYESGDITAYKVVRAESDGPVVDDDTPEVLHVGDPDTTNLPSIRAVYAGYVSFLDRWLSKILAGVLRVPGPTLLITTAMSGEDLNDESESEDLEPKLQAATLHVPLIVLVKGLTDGSRRAALVQLADIPATIVKWFGAESPHLADKMAWNVGLLPLIRNEISSLRDEIRLENDTQIGLWTTNAFYLRNKQGTAVELQESARYFEKPHDRWDHANVAMLVHGLADDLEQRIRQSD